MRKNFSDSTQSTTPGKIGKEKRWVEADGDVFFSRVTADEEKAESYLRGKGFLEHSQNVYIVEINTLAKSGNIIILIIKG